MVKKVVAIETCGALGITLDEKYSVKEEYKEFYSIINDYNKHAEIWKKRFKPLEEEMEIKVGSEWVGDHSSVATVKYVGEHKVFIKWNEDGSEGERFKESFLKNFKSKPIRRTVWLNVYSNFAQCHKDKETADRCKDSSVLYQQEVELIDPREGERNE